VSPTELALLQVGTFRLLAALPVLRWPLAGGLLAVAADLADLALMTYVTGWIPDYQAYDKLFDQFYMVTFLVVALRWEGLARRVALALFLARLLGVALFEATGLRPLLLAFPNLFELWFLFVAARDHLRPGWALTGRRTALVLAGLAALKLGQEWLLHVDRRLDGWSLPQVLDALRQALGGL
jgi:hypothetical protein